MKPVVIVPARLESTRLPRKVLLRESGKYLIEHVWERACEAAVGEVVLATDSEEVLQAAQGFGARALLTRADHPSGTDRVAEAARALAAEGLEFDLVVNLQGDEPELDPADLRTLVQVMEAEGARAEMGTLAEPIQDPQDLTRSQVVQVVVGADGGALYFSRSAIPHGAELGGDPAPLRHVGTYAYTPQVLQRICQLEPCGLERAERLEQLRALYHGIRIRVGVTSPKGARGIDTPEDYQAFLERARG
jgi:3-deoxy-manno-octulosonate cytidylyltransferase (CMP-KDO synthetase)